MRLPRRPAGRAASVPAGRAALVAAATEPARTGVEAAGAGLRPRWLRARSRPCRSGRSGSTGDDLPQKLPVFSADIKPSHDGQCASDGGFRARGRQVEVGVLDVRVAPRDGVLARPDRAGGALNGRDCVPGSAPGTA